MNGAFQVCKIQLVQVSRCPKYMGREQNIGKYCACKGALRRGALRQEFGFKLLFVPDKSALNAGGCCLTHPSTYTYTTTLAFKQEPNLGFQSFKNYSTTQLFCAYIFACSFTEMYQESQHHWGEVPLRGGIPGKRHSPEKRHSPLLKEASSDVQRIKEGLFQSPAALVNRP